MKQIKKTTSKKSLTFLSHTFYVYVVAFVKEKNQTNEREKKTTTDTNETERVKKSSRKKNYNNNKKTVGFCPTKISLTCVKIGINKSLLTQNHNPKSNESEIKGV